MWKGVCTEQKAVGVWEEDENKMETVSVSVDNGENPRHRILQEQQQTDRGTQTGTGECKISAFNNSAEKGIVDIWVGLVRIFLDWIFLEPRHSFDKESDFTSLNLHAQQNQFDGVFFQILLSGFRQFFEL